MHYLIIKDVPFCLEKNPNSYYCNKQSFERLLTILNGLGEKKLFVLTCMNDIPDLQI